MVAPLLKVEGVSKLFCRDTARSLRYGLADLGRSILPQRRTSSVLRPSEFWSLDQVSFEIRPGEALAIGGRNGAGKTTLLRVLAGLLKPDCGQITVRGTINPVIELGQGLNPMLTGRENAEIGLAWRGLNAGAIKALVPSVEEFAALGEMFNTPVNSYSAGMRVRLAFAIAASIPCDLLLLDEVLAVGDLAFQRKCIDHLQQHLARGGALILVSHNPVQMQALCRRGILLDQGKLVIDGAIEECIDQMFELQKAEQTDSEPGICEDAVAQIESVTIRNEVGNDPIISGEPVRLEISFTLKKPVDVMCSFSIWTRDRSVCITILIEPEVAALEPGQHTRYCQIPSMPLAHGVYALKASLVDPETLLSWANQGYSTAAVEFHVDEPVSRQSLLTRNTGQLVWLENIWSVDSFRPDLPVVGSDGFIGTKKFPDVPCRMDLPKC